MAIFFKKKPHSFRKLRCGRSYVNGVVGGVRGESLAAVTNCGVEIIFFPVQHR